MGNQRKALDTILGFKVRTIYPELARELEKKPIISDLSLIQEIFKTHYRPNTKKFVFIGAILYLYDPDILDGWKHNLCKGVRQRLAELFEVTPTAISNNIKIIQSYMLIYKKFKDNVEILANEIAAVYRQNNN